jgi:hypothetical protein
MVLTQLVCRVFLYVLPGYLFCVLTALPLHAQCDQNLRPVAGQAGYTARGSRCEGLYVSDVSAQSLELISLLRGKLHYDLQPDVQLTIVGPDISGIARGPIQVRAVAQPLRTYYRMDTVLPTNRRMVWPVKDVLFPLRLHADRVGVYGWIEAQPEKLFIPLRVISQGGSLPQVPIEVVVRSSLDVEGLVWRMAVDNTNPPPWQTGGANIPAGHPVTITLPEGPRTILRVEVAAKIENRAQWSKLNLRILRDVP